MKMNLNLGLTVDLGRKTLVFAVDNPVSVPTPEGPVVLIASKLADKGVEHLPQAGQVHFPGSGFFAAVITIDPEFGHVRVSELTPDALVLELRLLGDKISSNETQAKIKAAVDEVDLDSNLGRLILALTTLDTFPSKSSATISKAFSA